MEYEIGDIIQGEITGIQSYGAFVKIVNGENGLIHISEISSYFVKDIHNFVSVGQIVKVKVIGILTNRSLYRLSLKQVGGRNRQNIRHSKPTHGYRKRYQIPPEQQNFAPLKEHLTSWVQEELKKMEEDKND